MEWNAATLGIPTLDLGMQAHELVTPVTKWGTIPRSSAMAGTYHFYADDYRFSALAKHPMKLVDSGCSVAVEPNYSTSPDLPMAQALAHIYLKRTLAREWQHAGIRIIADLSVDPTFREANTLGIPPGWSSFAVRSHHYVEAWEIERDYQLAALIAGGTPRLFVVFGGGKSLRAMCEARGWTHVPEHRHVVEGREPAYGSR